MSTKNLILFFLLSVFIVSAVGYAYYELINIILKILEGV
jgi:hypothetical protein